MNGRDLSQDHGYPVRALVPGHYGMASVKWLTGIHAIREPFQGYWQTSDYGYWDYLDGKPVRHALGEMKLKSEIARPSVYETLEPNRVYTVFGAAWAGESEVAQIAVSTDGGQTWAEAQFLDPAQRHTWRRWKLLAAAFVAFLLWPEYAGDSLLPRVRKVISDTLALAPDGSVASTEDEIQRANADTMRILAEILHIADDAQMEGRTSTVNHNAIVEAAGTLRRIANRLASIATGRIVTPVPQLDPMTESAHAAVLDAIRRHLHSWFDFFSSTDSLSSAAAQAIARAHSPDDLRTPLEQFGSRLAEREFARIESWTLDERRVLLAELQSMRRLEFLVPELNRWLAQIPGPALNPEKQKRTARN